MALKRSGSTISLRWSKLIKCCMAKPIHIIHTKKRHIIEVKIKTSSNFYFQDNAKRSVLEKRKAKYKWYSLFPPKCFSEYHSLSQEFNWQMHIFLLHNFTLISFFKMSMMSWVRVTCIKSLIRLVVTFSWWFPPLFTLGSWRNIHANHMLACGYEGVRDYLSVLLCVRYTCIKSSGS